GAVHHLRRAALRPLRGGLPGGPRRARARRRRPPGDPDRGLHRVRLLRACLPDHAVVVRPHPRGELMPDVPYTVEKPWGHELVWARTDRYVGKVLHVKAGHVLSLQYHNRKDETMHVLRGELLLRTREGDALRERPFRAGESV